jgi:hypothetical protein
LNALQMNASNSRNIRVRSEKGKQMINASRVGHETEASVDLKLSFPDGFK